MGSTLYYNIKNTSAVGLLSNHSHLN